MSCLRNLLCLGIIIPSVLSFSTAGYSSLPKIPSSSKERNDQAISGIKAAIKNPRYPSFPLVECEFPVLDALNKLGDGSLRSTLEAEGANIEFVKQLVKGLSPPIPFFGGQKVSLFTSSDASKSFVSRLKQEIGTTADVYSLRDRIIPNNVARDEICVFVTPSAKSDYQTAVKFAESESIKAVIIVNGYAKDQKSIPGTATMGYYLKPLTYNSQVAGYLIRSYPSPWVVLDSFSKGVLATFSDNQILVPKTNTPDLRDSVKLIQQKSVDQAIRSRQKN